MAMQSRPEADLILFQVVLDKRIVADGLPAYVGRGTILVPVRQLFGALEIPVQLDFASARATGSVSDEGPSFEVDLVKQVLVVGRRTLRIAPGQAELHADDVYLDVTLLRDALEIDSLLLVRETRLVLKPLRPLPLQLRWSREERLRKAGVGWKAAPVPLPRLTPGYSLLGGLALDSTFSLRLAEKSLGGVLGNYSTFAAFDVLGMEAGLYLSGTSGDLLLDERFAVGRRDPFGGLLGPLRAREFAVGHVWDPGSPLLTRAGFGLGGVVTNYPLLQGSEIDRKTFRGPLPPGWQVELYRDGSLVDFQAAGADGLYEFQDVPLLPGVNAFRLVFYGPFGQVREEKESFNVSSYLARPGSLRYRLLASDPGERDARALVEASYGLSDRVTVTAASGLVEVLGERLLTSRVGARATLGRVFSTIDAAVSEGGGWAFDVSAQTRLGGVGILARQAIFSDFRSQLYPSSQESQSFLRLDTQIPFGSRVRIPVSAEATRDAFASGQERYRIVGRLSGSVGRLQLGSELYWYDVNPGADPAAEPRWFTHRARIGLGRVVLRAAARQELRPESRFTDLDVGGESTVDSSRFQVGLGRSWRRSQSRVYAGVARSTGLFGYGATVTYFDPGGFEALLSLNLGLRYDDWSERLHVSAAPSGRAGAASAFAYVDRNANDLFDTGDEPLEDVSFELNGSRRPPRTGPDGRLLIESLGTSQATNIALARSSLPDPYGLLPARPGFSVVPRAARVARLEFPVVPVGQISGSVHWRRGRELSPIGGVFVEVVSPTGAVRTRAPTAFDGYFEAIDVPAGPYRLRISAESLRRLGVPPEAGSERAFEISPDGGAVDGLDLAIDDALVPKVQRASVEEPRRLNGIRLVRSARTEAASPPEETRPASVWSVQVAVVCDPEKVDPALRKLRGSGLAAWAARRELNGRECWRILIGEWGSAELARRAARAVGTNPVQPAETPFVVRLEAGSLATASGGSGPSRVATTGFAGRSLRNRY